MKLLVGILLIAAQLKWFAVADEASASGPAPPNNDLSRQCPDYVAPVCGVDNITYRNICYLELATTKQYDGACAQESCICAQVVQPVCASDYKTYSNQCYLNCEIRRRFALGLPPLYGKHFGHCFSCTKTYNPVCASNGKSYWNACYLKLANLIRVYKGLPPFKIKHKGRCYCNCLKCSKQFSPVCGTNNETFYNYCWLRCYSNCHLSWGWPNIFVKKSGYC